MLQGLDQTVSDCLAYGLANLPLCSIPLGWAGLLPFGETLAISGRRFRIMRKVRTAHHLYLLSTTCKHVPLSDLQLRCVLKHSMQQLVPRDDGRLCRSWSFGDA